MTLCVYDSLESICSSSETRCTNKIITLISYSYQDQGWGTNIKSAVLVAMRSLGYLPASPCQVLLKTHYHTWCTLPGLHLFRYNAVGRLRLDLQHCSGSTYQQASPNPSPFQRCGWVASFLRHSNSPTILLQQDRGQFTLHLMSNWFQYLGNLFFHLQYFSFQINFTHQILLS